MQPSPSICLNMIVKDESAVIERCLQSVRAHVHSWVIVDTGSSDDTIAKIEQAMAGIPGAVYRRPWVDFGHNRSEAAQLAATCEAASDADYLLFMDADDVLVAPDGFAWPALQDDAYHVMLHLNELRYARTMLVATRLQWRWEGVLHEYPVAEPPAVSTGLVQGMHIKSSTEGARSNDPLKYHKDAQVLRNALVKEPNNARYAFYLAQSLRDAGDLNNALKAYRHRVRMGGWVQEQWRAALEAARLEERLANPLGTVEQSYLAAFELRVQRAEPLVDLARLMRVNQRYARAYLYASQACKLPVSTDSLFVESAVYNWMRWDELSIAAYWVGEYQESLSLCDRLLNEADLGANLPPAQHERVLSNRQFAVDRLAGV